MVVIVLAAFNGEEHIAEQIESIRNQSRPDWTLLVRDDGSTDRTVSIVERFCSRDARIRLLKSDGPRSGPAANFCRLLLHAEQEGAEYVFFSDQDDVWRPDKLQLQLDAMRSLETLHGTAVPMLVHTDMIETDAHLNVARASYADHKNYLLGTADPLATLMTANFVTGCTILINRALLKVSLPIPAIAVMHDHWLALCAAAAGHIGYLPQPTLYYRRHSHNYSRAATPWPSPQRFVAGGYWSAERLSQFATRIAQLRVLHAHLHAQDLPLAADSLSRVDAYCRLFETPGPWLKRLYCASRLGVPRMGFLRKIQFLMLVRKLGSETIGVWATPEPGTIPAPFVADGRDPAEDTSVLPSGERLCKPFAAIVD